MRIMMMAWLAISATIAAAQAVTAGMSWGAGGFIAKRCSGPAASSESGVNAFRGDLGMMRADA